MQKEVLIVTSDNVFYLLLKTFIESKSLIITCHKIMDHISLYEQSSEETSLIIVDGKMADISPIELIYRARYDYKLKLPIWYVTEINTSVYLKKVLEVGANRIISKPIDVDEFSDLVLNQVV